MTFSDVDIQVAATETGVPLHTILNKIYILSRSASWPVSVAALLIYAHRVELLFYSMDLVVLHIIVLDIVGSFIGRSSTL